MTMDYKSEEYRGALRSHGFEPLLVADLCDRNARVMPKREAVADMDGNSLRWRDVSHLSDRLAAALTILGFQPGDVLLFLLPLGVHLFLLRVVCEKAGVRYLVGSHDSPERIGRIMQTLGARAIITNEIKRYPTLEEFRFIDLGDDKGGISTLLGLANSLSPSEIEGIRRRRATPFDPIEIRPSSGTTTGFPRFTDKIPCSLMFSQFIRQRRLRITSEDVYALFGGYRGAADGHGYYGFPMAGAKALFISQVQEASDIPRSLDFARTKGATIMHRVPFLDSFFPEHIPASVRLIFNNRPSFSPDLARRIEASTGARIFSGYSTEYGGISGCFWEDTQDVRLDTDGKPLEGNEVRIVSLEGNVLPPGTEGLIQVKGLHANLGCYRDAEETRKRWVSGWYDTRDWGYLNNEGRLTLLGRLDKEGKVTKWR